MDPYSATGVFDIGSDEDNKSAPNGWQTPANPLLQGQYLRRLKRSNNGSYARLMSNSNLRTTKERYKTFTRVLNAYYKVGYNNQINNRAQRPYNT